MNPLTFAWEKIPKFIKYPHPNHRAPGVDSTTNSLTVEEYRHKEKQ